MKKFIAFPTAFGKLSQAKSPEVSHSYHSAITYLFSFFPTPKPPILGVLKAVFNKQTSRKGQTTP